MSQIRIATRNSPLALWQAKHVQQLLLKHHPELDVNLIPMTTKGDQYLNTPLAAIGGKGLFIKELEHALMDHSADIAVHSMKDVTVDFPEGLKLCVILQREDPRDALISSRYANLDDLPEQAVVGTSSVRRQCQIRKFRSDLKLKDLRGNVGTRLKKLDDGEYDAIILAAAGVKRLGLQARIAQLISTDTLLPAIGQAAIGIESRQDDPEIDHYLACLNHQQTAVCVNAERVVSEKLFGGCQLPIAAFAELDSDAFSMRAMVGTVDGTKTIEETISGDLSESSRLASALSDRLLARGADKILADLLRQ